MNTAVPIHHCRHQAGQKAADEGKNDPRSRWKRAVFLAARLQNGESIPSAEIPDEGGVHPKSKLIPREGEHKSKILETQHWLELIDGYASSAHPLVLSC